MKVTLIILGVFALIALAKGESCSMASDCMTLACKGMEACEMGTCTCSTSGGATQSPGDGLHGNQCNTASDCGAHLHHCVSGTTKCTDGHCRCSHH